MCTRLNFIQTTIIDFVVQTCEWPLSNCTREQAHNYPHLDYILLLNKLLRSNNGRRFHPAFRWTLLSLIFASFAACKYKLNLIRKLISSLIQPSVWVLLLSVTAFQLSRIILNIYQIWEVLTQRYQHPALYSMFHLSVVIRY